MTALDGSTIHIDPSVLLNLQGKILFYPAAGSDWDEFLSCFCDHVGEFHFCDITYNFERLAPLLGQPVWQCIACKQQGESFAQVEPPNERRPYRYVKPAHLRQVYQRNCDERRLEVIRRRGFGQYALAEFPDRSIKVFVHRGDSPGESGSNM